MTAVQLDSVTPGCTRTETPHDIDIPALRQKYRAERDTRLRSDGSTQYLELSGQLAGFSEMNAPSATALDIRYIKPRIATEARG